MRGGDSPPHLMTAVDEVTEGEDAREYCSHGTVRGGGDRLGWRIGLQAGCVGLQDGCIGLQDGCIGLQAVRGGGGGGLVRCLRDEAQQAAVAPQLAVESEVEEAQRSQPRQHLAAGEGVCVRGCRICKGCRMVRGVAW